MVHLVNRITLAAIALIIATFSVNVIGVMDVYADSHAPANNGTLKLHELNAPVGTDSNNPHVCAFNFEGYQFDDSQQGQIRITTQGGGTPVLGPLPFGAADANGYVSTAYINDGVSGITLADGHYKATLYGKNGEDLGSKAKSKVFWVACAATPTATIQSGACILPGASNGTASGTVTNTNDATNDSVIYTVKLTGPTTKTTTLTIADGSTKNFLFGGLSAGVYTLTVTGNDGTSVATKTVTIAVCDTPVTPVAPTMDDLCGTSDDTYTIPSKAGVTYYVNGIATSAGTYAATGTVVIEAVANAGYTLQGTALWTFNFKATPCVIKVTPTAPTAVDICGTTHDTYTIPAKAGVIYKVNGTVTPAGTYDGHGIVVVTAVADAGYALQGTTTWVFVFTNLPCVITPAAPTMTDMCGTANDTYTIPQTTGVKYYVNFVEKSAGTYTTNVPVLIVAVPQPGYIFGIHAQASWLFTYSHKKCQEPCHPTVPLIGLTFFGHRDDDDDDDCIPVAVTPAVPTASDNCGTANDTYTIPATTGVTYYVDGVATGAGTYKTTNSVTITATANKGYVLANGAAKSWQFTFPNSDSCPVPPEAHISATAVCSQTGVLVTLTNSGDGDGIALVNDDEVAVPAKSTVTTTVPFTLFKADVLVGDDRENTLIDKTFDCTPGRGDVTPPAVDNPTVPPSTPLVKQTAAHVAMPTELPTTGPSTLLTQVIIMMILAITTYGATYYLQDRLDFLTKK